MSIADKALTISANNTTIAENQQKVYDAGYSNGKDSEALQIWNMMTCNGTQNDWQRLFQRTNFSNYEFIKPIAPKGNEPVQHMFYDYMGKYLPKNLDFSGLNPSVSVASMFSWATSLLEIYDIGLPAMNAYSWNEAYNCKKIAILRVHEGTSYQFLNIKALEEITFEGVIGKDLNLSPATKLKHDSLTNIITCLKDYSADTSGTAHKLTLGSANINKLSTEEQQIITDKGWTLA